MEITLDRGLHGWRRPHTEAARVSLAARRTMDNLVLVRVRTGGGGLAAGRPDRSSPETRRLQPARLRRLLQECAELRRRQLAGEALRPGQITKLAREGTLRCALAEACAPRASSCGTYGLWICANPLRAADNDVMRDCCRMPRCGRRGPERMDAVFQCAWRRLTAARWSRAARLIQRAWRRRRRQQAYGVRTLGAAVRGLSGATAPLTQRPRRREREVHKLGGPVAAAARAGSTQAWSTSEAAPAQRSPRRRGVVALDGPPSPPAPAGGGSAAGHFGDRGAGQREEHPAEQQGLRGARPNGRQAMQPGTTGAEQPEGHPAEEPERRGAHPRTSAGGAGGPRGALPGTNAGPMAGPPPASPGQAPAMPAPAPQEFEDLDRPCPDWCRRFNGPAYLDPYWKDIRRYVTPAPPQAAELQQARPGLPAPPQAAEVPQALPGAPAPPHTSCTAGPAGDLEEAQLATQLLQHQLAEEAQATSTERSPPAPGSSPSMTMTHGLGHFFPAAVATPVHRAAVPQERSPEVTSTACCAPCTATSSRTAAARPC